MTAEVPAMALARVRAVVEVEPPIHVVADERRKE
jgi:hypothetical protein